MGEWLGLGTSAVSHLSAVHYGALGWEKVDENVVSVHVTNSLSLKSFLAGEYRDQEKTELLDQQEYTKERFLVWLRVMEGIVIDVQTSTLLVPNRKEKITLYAGEWLCLRDEEMQRLSLTDSGMDVYNSIVSELLQEV
jgi:coproporphyrinogen III oxidase-like Fe-S oxidoreductase